MSSDLAKTEESELPDDVKAIVGEGANQQG